MTSSDIKLEMSERRLGGAGVDFRIVELSEFGDETVWPGLASTLPHIVHAKIDAGMTIPAAAHSSWYSTYVLAGSGTVDGHTLKAGDVIISPPWAEAGEFVSGPDGYEEFTLFNDGPGVYPHLTSAPADSETLQRLFGIFEPDVIAFTSTIEAPTGEREFYLDNDKNRFNTPFYSSKLWESGPMGWIDSDKIGPAHPDIVASSNPFLSQTVIPGGEDMPKWPDHRHEGWTFLYILDGYYQESTMRLDAGQMWITAPSHVFDARLRPGPDGVSEIAVFGDGPSVTPIILSDSSPDTATFAQSLQL
ncbi:hypothetical protein [Agreia sp. VKM Ac-1783]|uniref:hypothetical protein n=1 Tax=Agreia sp. VKM Ac-1783 TaxID=1938889 RepID=UPI000A3B43B2|nr:hypothetical protein [Agreia sp. VKM Ac-1783]